jgi:hypothetical protein
MLLEHDGLDEHWAAGVPSDWQGDLGQHDQADLDRLPVAITQLHNPALSCNYDLSAMGRGQDFYDKKSAYELHLEPEGSVAQVLTQSDGAMLV